MQHLLHERRRREFDGFLGGLALCETPARLGGDLLANLFAAFAQGRDDRRNFLGAFDARVASDLFVEQAGRLAGCRFAIALALTTPPMSGETTIRFS